MVRISQFQQRSAEPDTTELQSATWWPSTWSKTELWSTRTVLIYTNLICLALICKMLICMTLIYMPDAAQLEINYIHSSLHWSLRTAHLSAFIILLQVVQHDTQEICTKRNSLTKQKYFCHRTFSTSHCPGFSGIRISFQPVILFQCANK